MNQETRHSEIQIGEFDAGSISPTEHDWAIISGSKLIAEPSERCHIIGDLAVLDPQQTISIPTRKDWNWFIRRTTWLNKESDVIVRNPLIREMAKVEREKARKVFNLGELDENWESAFREVLKGEQEVGLYQGSLQELIIYADPKRAKRIFAEYGETAWNS